MATSVTMPRLGESVSEGTITRWLKKEGEHVDADEPLLEVSTDKVDTEIPAPASGVLKSIRVQEDETVEVGAEIAVIDEGGEAAGEQPTEEREQPPQREEQQRREEPREREQPERRPEETAEEPAGAEPAPPAQRRQVAEEDREQAARAQQRAPEPRREEPRREEPRREEPEREVAEGDGHGGGSAYVTPLVRRLAAEHDVDLSQVHGTGVGGRIRKQDVLDAARAGAPAEPEPRVSARAEPSEQIRTPARQPTAAPQATADQATAGARFTHVRGRTEKLSRLRQVIAERMTESLRISAQLTTVVECDVTKIARLIQAARGDFAEREGVKLRFLPFFAVATCEALREHPNVNASIDMEQRTVTYHDAVHLGVAVDTPRGLLVPVIHDADDLNLAGLARKIADLAERTRSNQISPDELGGGTFALTNTGSRGAIFDTPIINQPNVGVLGTGAVVKRPVVVDDPDLGEVIAVRHIVYLALTYDHRLVDGADAARFLETVKTRLEDGAFEADLGL